MQIKDGEATIKVLALTLEEAMMRVDSFLFGVDDESN